MHPKPRHIYEFGPYRVDPENRELLRGADRLLLTPRAFDTLLVLLESGGKLVSKHELMERVWSGSFVEEATMRQHIYTLRKALAGPYIETRAREGYRFAVPVTKLPLPEDRESAEGPLRVLAVLPFVALGLDEKDEFLGLCMADALIARLSPLGRITVRPTSAVMRFAEGAVASSLVAAELRADAILQGTVQRDDTRMRVTVQLVDGQNASLWGEKFDVVYTDSFALQDTISERVVDALRIRMTREEHERLSARPTRSTAAHRAYVKGRYFWNKRSEQGLRSAIRHFEEALAHDPDYALAFAGLADSHALLPLYGDVPSRAAFDRARELAQRALEIDESLGEAHTSLAYTRFFQDWDLPAAEASYRRAIQLSPGYPTTHHWYSFLLSATGRHEEAHAAIEHALDLDPLSLAISTDLGMTLYFDRRYAAAVEQYMRVLELEPGFAYAHFGLSLAHAALGRAEPALAAARRVRELSPASTLGLAAEGYAHAVAGDRVEAERVLSVLEDGGPERSEQAGRRALVRAGLAHHDAALDDLEQACDERSRFVLFLDVWPAFDDLRPHPRFRRLLARIGLASA